MVWENVTVNQTIRILQEPTIQIIAIESNLLSFLALFILFSTFFILVEYRKNVIYAIVTILLALANMNYIYNSGLFIESVRNILTLTFAVMAFYISVLLIRAFIIKKKDKWRW